MSCTRCWRGGDDYASSAKPQIDWDDPQARNGLIKADRARDALACLALLDGRDLGPAVAEAAQLLATVVGQDLEESSDGTFRIARRVAPDRVISTVDPEARHGHKTANRGFDGYKGHVALDPDSEVITNTAVTPANDGDATVAEELIVDLLDGDGAAGTDTAVGCAGEAGTAGARCRRGGGQRRADRLRRQHVRDRRVPVPARGRTDRLALQDPGADRGGRAVHQGPLPHRPRGRHRGLPQRGTRRGPPLQRRQWHGLLRWCLHALPGARAVHHRQRRADHRDQPPRRGAGARSRPAGRPGLGGRLPRHPAQGRAQARAPDAAQPRRPPGPSVRGTRKVGADFNLLAAAQNLAERLAALGLRSVGGRWEVVTA